MGDIGGSSVIGNVLDVSPITLSFRILSGHVLNVLPITLDDHIDFLFQTNKLLLASGIDH